MHETQKVHWNGVRESKDAESASLTDLLSGTGLWQERPVPSAEDCGVADATGPWQGGTGPRRRHQREWPKLAKSRETSSRDRLWWADRSPGTDLAGRDRFPNAWKMGRSSGTGPMSGRLSLWNTQGGVGRVRRFRRPGLYHRRGVCDDFAAGWVSRFVAYTVLSVCDDFAAGWLSHRVRWAVEQPVCGLSAVD
uniref:Uncharacterized protein n=1 Tax=Ananas comosus var. bracteatus TaxID=296719 RepID=A0A6V7NF44_ANACO|nr:unnamed protein product [Ananas comosus var. bracteatus]